MKSGLRRLTSLSVGAKIATTPNWNPVFRTVSLKVSNENKGGQNYEVELGVRVYEVLPHKGFTKVIA